jgi:hypothetical protein
MVLSLMGQRLRGQWKLASVKRDMVRRGQIADLEQAITPLAPNHEVFTNRYNRVIAALGNSLLSGGGNQVAVAPRLAARGSQSPYPITADLNPVFTNARAVIPGDTNTWAWMDDYYADKEQHLKDLRLILQSAPTNAAVDLREVLRNGFGFQFRNMRVGVQILNDAIMLNLHRGNVAGAHENLIALSAFMRMHADDATLAAQMIRAATSGIAASALWDAMQADGWSEPQLAELQRAWDCRSLVESVVHTLHVERLGRLEYYEGLRRMSYRSWCAPHKATFAGFGCLPPYPAGAEFFRHYLFHPIWQVAWAHEEMALCLEESEFLTTIGQRALQDRRFADVPEQWKNAVKNRRTIFGAKRFYLEIPYMDAMSWTGARTPSLLEHVFSRCLRNSFETLPEFSKALTTAAEYEIRREMAATSIALKRYQLRRGDLPEQLSELVPEYLSEVPVDWMDGQPLRYVRDADDTYILYSVGHDGKDDGGDGSPVEQTSWPTRDIVWPKAVPWASAAESSTQ